MYRKATFLFVFSIFLCLEAFSQKAHIIYVNKSQKILRVFDKSGVEIAKYNIALGGQPEGHKQFEGDQRTPEGLYKINYKKQDSSFHLALQINYPNKRDRENARQLGKDPGGDIMIHGLPNNFDSWFSRFPDSIKGWIKNDGSQYHYLVNWTDGCIAITNEEIEELWAMVSWGTWVKIEY